MKLFAKVKKELFFIYLDSDNNPLIGVVWVLTLISVITLAGIFCGAVKF